MSFNYPNQEIDNIKIPSDVQYAVGVDGINTKVLPAGAIPRVVYRIGDGTVQDEGWENIEGNKYLDFYMPISSAPLSYSDAVEGGFTGTESEWNSIYNIIVTSIDDIKLVASDIDSVNIIADAITSGNNALGGQFLGNSVLGSVMFTGQSTNENLVLPEGTNGLIVGGLTIENGGSLTQENGTTLKVV